VRFRVKNWFTAVLLFGAAYIAPVTNASSEEASSAAALSTARQEYGDAMQAIDTGRWTEYEQLRPGLDDYPLAMYLDYQQLSRQVNQVRPVDAQRFISLSADSPLPNRFLSVYLKRAGRDQRWKDFLQVMPEEPNSVELKCYYFRAKLAQGDALLAWEGAERLWVYGNSRPKPCDPLFAAWMKSGQISDEVVWARLLAAFDERQSSLMTYVAKKGSQQLRPWADKLLAVYRKPDKIQQQSLPKDSPYSADIASHGLSYLARYNPEKALAYWEQYQNQLSFSPEQTQSVEYAIALYALFARNDAMVPWIQQALARVQEDKLVELRLRWALREQDWAALEQTLPLLSPEQREAEVWRYWQAILWERQGDTGRANEMMVALAAERSYYGFLAAGHLGKAYAFNRRQLVLEPADADKLRQLPPLRRIGELNYHEQYNLAHSEWYKVLQDSPDAGQTQQLAQLANQQGWYRMGIDAASAAKAWDALDVRFPMPYQQTFEQYASVQGVPSSELMAIARRESAFYPQARSPVGARGLMQLMPATGKQVASSLGHSARGLNLEGVDLNVQLGSTYYRQLLDRFDGNRVFALTAYNAGPHRVDRWRSKAGEAGLPVEIWVETIPYQETRNYVQAVLSYNVVFQHLAGNSRELFNPAEQQARY
jgi:soluble lytic murein transglycosylase